MTDTLPMVEDLEVDDLGARSSDCLGDAHLDPDIDLEPSPYGHHGGRKNRAGDMDLRKQRHRVRNLIEDYRYLASFGMSSAAIVARLGLSDEDYALVRNSAYRTGTALPKDQHVTNQVEKEESWKCSLMGCTRCGGSL